MSQSQLSIFESFEAGALKQKKALYLRAVELRKQYWDVWTKKNEGKTGKDRGYCAVYVRWHKGSAEIHWKRLLPTVDKKTEKRHTKYIKRGRKDAYTAASIKAASQLEWEIELILEYEAKFAEIRKAIRTIGDAVRASKVAEKNVTAIIGGGE